MKKYELPLCPVEKTLFFIGNRWKILIIRALVTGMKRVGELKNAINGISQKVLTQNLRMMEEQALITRVVHAEVPLRVEYSLTEAGRTLVKWPKEILMTKVLSGRSLETVLDTMSHRGESKAASMQCDGLSTNNNDSTFEPNLEIPTNMIETVKHA